MDDKDNKEVAVAEEETQAEKGPEEEEEAVVVKEEFHDAIESTPAEAPPVVASAAGAKADSAEEEKEEKGANVAKAQGSDEKDGDEEGGGNSSNLFRLDSGLLPFPEKLMALLDGDQVADAMWWLPDGDAFCLIPVVFAEKVLDKYFQGTKFESFTRKLNRWGFKRVAGQKVPANTIAYYNKHFLRGKPKLLKNMNGGKTKFVSAREKRVRAQLKRERDREQAVLIAAQQQALYADRLGLARAGLQGGMAGLPQVGLGAAANFGFAANPALLAGRPAMAGFQNPEDLRMAEHVFAAEQALALQQQREELQMRLLRSGAYGAMGFGPGTMQDPQMNQLLAARMAAGQPMAGALGVGNPAFGLGDQSGAPSAEQLLLARQQAVSAGGNDAAETASKQQQQRSADEATAKIVQQRMEEQQMINTKALLAQQQQQQKPTESIGAGVPSDLPTGDPSAASAAAAGQVDPQLLQLYLLDQQRKKETSDANQS